MSKENRAWEPVIVCESCDDFTEAEYVVIDVTGKAAFVCNDHAQDWYDEGSAYLVSATRRLKWLDEREKSWVLDTPENKED